MATHRQRSSGIYDQQSYGTAEGRVGAAAMALGWTAVLCQFLAFAGIVLLILSIKVLADFVE